MLNTAEELNKLGLKSKDSLHFAGTKFVKSTLDILFGESLSLRISKDLCLDNLEELYAGLNEAYKLTEDTAFYVNFSNDVQSVFNKYAYAKVAASLKALYENKDSIELVND